MDLQEVRTAGEALRNILVLPTYPVAVKLIKNAEDWPQKVRHPKDQGVNKWAVCQAIAMTRKIGWTVGLEPAESFCVPSNILFGWAKTEDEMALANAWLEMGVGENIDATKRIAKELDQLRKGEYSGIVFSPLQWSRIVPDVVLFYCDPVRAGVLIQACTSRDGKPFQSAFIPTAACVQSIFRPLVTGEPKMTIPCVGERGLSGSQDNELIFSFPIALLKDVVEGLEKARDAGYGCRIPVAPYLTFEPVSIPPYAKLGEKTKIINR